MPDHKLPEDTLAALEHLVRTAKKDGVMVVGFALCDDEKHLAMMNYGDSRFSRNIAFYKEACEVTERKIKQGNTIVHNLSEVM
jgi:hypothetical protein